jgi:hypothetical protein
MPAPILALIERNKLEESENLSEMSVSRRCKVSTHCEFCKLKIQLASFQILQVYFFLLMLE